MPASHENAAPGPVSVLELGLWRCLGWQRSGLAGPIDLKTSKTRDLAPIDS